MGVLAIKSSAWPPAARAFRSTVSMAARASRAASTTALPASVGTSRLPRESEHGDAVFDFEGADGARDHRLGDTQRSSGGAHGAEVADSDEVAQLLDVHAQRA